MENKKYAVRSDYYEPIDVATNGVKFKYQVLEKRLNFNRIRGLRKR